MSKPINPQSVSKKLIKWVPGQVFNEFLQESLQYPGSKRKYIPEDRKKRNCTLALTEQ